MGILQGIFKPLDKPQDALGGSRYCFFFGNTSAGKPVNEQTAMQMTAVYSCVSSMVPGNETAKTLIRELKLSKINSSRIVAWISADMMPGLAWRKWPEMSIALKIPLLFNTHCIQTRTHRSQSAASIEFASRNSLRCSFVPHPLRFQLSPSPPVFDRINWLQGGCGRKVGQFRHKLYHFKPKSIPLLSVW